MRRLMRAGIEYRSRFGSLKRCLAKCRRSAPATHSQHQGARSPWQHWIAVQRSARKGLKADLNTHDGHNQRGASMDIFKISDTDFSTLSDSDLAAAAFSVRDAIYRDLAQRAVKNIGDCYLQMILHGQSIYEGWRIGERIVHDGTIIRHECFPVPPRVIPRDRTTAAHTHAAPGDAPAGQ